MNKICEIYWELKLENGDIICESNEKFSEVINQKKELIEKYYLINNDVIVGFDKHGVVFIDDRKYYLHDFKLNEFLPYCLKTNMIDINTNKEFFHSRKIGYKIKYQENCKVECYISIDIYGNVLLGFITCENGQQKQVVETIIKR